MFSHARPDATPSGSAMVGRTTREAPYQLFFRVGKNQLGEQTASKARCRAMRGTTVELPDSRVLSAALLSCRIFLSAEIESEPSRQSIQAAQRLAIAR